jgi:adhesin/invasin
MARNAFAAALAVLLAACGGGEGGTPACPSGQARCGDACVDLATDAGHCGACPTACAATQVCADGACGCAGSLSSCGTTCVDLQSSAVHCGSCANACPAGAACTAGACLAVCSAPETTCGLTCRNLAISPAACGRCDRACAAGASCAAAACVTAPCAGLLDLPGPPRLPLAGEALAAADLDGDGRPDLVAASNAAVVVALGAGHGRFTALAPTALPPGSWASALALGELDGDGLLDLAVADRNGQVHLLHGIGDGTFGAPTTLSVLQGADGLALADLDRDGDLDLAVASQGAGAQGDLAVWLNEGGAFSGHASLVVTGRPSDVVAADVNGDGRLDLLASEYALGRVSVFLGRAGGFEPERLVETGGGTQTLAVADLDRDGWPDLVTSSATPGASTTVSLGAGDGTFGTATGYGVGGDTVAVADLDGDGQLDVATATGQVLRGTGGGALAVEPLGVQTSATAGLVARDLDGDGRLDLAFGSGLLALGAEGGGWLLPATLAEGTAFALADLDGDLEPDLVSYDHPYPFAPGIFVRRGLGDGRFGPPTAAAPAALLGTQVGALGDLDGDGRLDLATAQDTTLTTLTGDGTGAFAPLATHQLPAALLALALGDLDGDGLADLVTVDAPATPDGGGALRVWRRTAGGFDPPVLVADDATLLLAADLDGDGRPDVAASRGSAVSIWFEAHTFAFGVPLTISRQHRVSGLAAGDLDGDGAVDLLVTAGAGQTWDQYDAAVVPALGGGAFGLPLPFMAGWAPRRPLLADLDGDGWPDLLAWSESHNQLVLVRNAGDGSFGDPEQQAAGGVPVATADLDRDGRPDLVCGLGLVQVRLTRCRP